MVLNVRCQLETGVALEVWAMKAHVLLGLSMRTASF